MWVVRVVTAYFLIQGLVGLVLPPNPSIIVVGSGPSGIAAATRLLKNNFTDVKVLEAENRIGGRINSVKFGDAYVDLGAEYCHGQEGNIVYTMVKDLGILNHSHLGMQFYRSNGAEIGDATAEKIYNFSQSLFASDEPPDGCEKTVSVGECLDIKAKIFQTTGQDAKERDVLSEAQDWTNCFLCSYDSPLDLHDLTISTEYKECGGDLHMNWNGLGYKTILEVMIQKYPNKEDQLPIEDKIFLEKIVSKISNWQNGDKVLVTTTDGGTYKADHVIFTPSVGVLKANYEDLFSPPLPEEKIDAIKNTGFGAILKVILHFSERWWKEDAAWGFIWAPDEKEKLKEKKLEWLIDLNGFAQAENNPNVLIAWYAGSHIPLIESLPDDKIWEGHIHVINSFLAPHYNVTLPDKVLRTSWYTNPHFRGTYSYESVQGHSRGGDNFQNKLGKPLTNKDDTPTILFAGEATHPYYFSTVHGAIETGYREADRLIKLYEN